MTVDNIFAVESNAFPSYDEIKKLPNKVLLWCGKKLMHFQSLHSIAHSLVGFGCDFPSCIQISLQEHAAQI